MQTLESGKDFQRECLHAVENLLSSRGVPSVFEWVKGKEESYLCAQVAYNSDKIEIYIYIDEAGFFLGGDWHAYEAVDFDAPQKLIETLVRDLEAIFDSNSRNRTASLSH